MDREPLLSQRQVGALISKQTHGIALA